MQPSRYLYVPYRIARLPLAALDGRLRSRLGTGSPMRALTRTVLGTVDRVAAAAFDEAPLRID